jgi:hypothetical protein
MAKRGTNGGRVVRLCVVALVVTALLALFAGCSPSDSTSSGSPSPGSAAGASCGQVKKAANELGSTVDKWQAGNATRNQVVASADKLMNAVGGKVGAATGQVGKDFAALGKAIRDLVHTATSPGVTQQQIKQAAAKVSAAADALGTTCK